MRTMRSIVTAAMLAALSAGCSASTGTADTANPSAPRQARDRNVITRDQLMNATGESAYDVVQRLRPRWLSVRGGSRSLMGMDSRIVVFADNVQIGGTEALRQIPATSVESIRWLDGSTASNSLPGVGTNEHIVGAILVTRVPRG